MSARKAAAVRLHADQDFARLLKVYRAATEAHEEMFRLYREGREKLADVARRAREATDAYARSPTVKRATLVANAHVEHERMWRLHVVLPIDVSQGERDRARQDVLDHIERRYLDVSAEVRRG